MVQEHLGPALLHTYIAVDTAEGVDVDKEDFEKYGARYGQPPATRTHMLVKASDCALAMSISCWQCEQCVPC